MNTTTLLQNLKYIALGLVLAGSLTLIHAQFNPTTTPPGGNIPAPLHTGPNQVKDGGLSVDTLAVSQGAAFQQQTFLNSIIYGGSPTDTTPNSTVVIGDGTAPANVSVNGKLSAATFVQSDSVANNDSSALCANASGTLVTCNAGPTAPAPSITLINSGYDSSGKTAELFAIGSSVLPGDTFSFTMYYHTVTYTAQAGDNTEIVVQRLVSAINNTTDAQWRENPYTSTTSRPGDTSVAPPAGTPGYPPTASAQQGNASYIKITLDHNHQVNLYYAQRK